MTPFKLYFHYLNTFDTFEKVTQKLKPILQDPDNAKAIIFLLKEKTIICKNLFNNLNKKEASNFLQDYLNYKLYLKKGLTKKNPYYVYEKYQTQLYQNLVNLTNEISLKNEIKAIILPY